MKRGLFVGLALLCLTASSAQAEEEVRTPVTIGSRVTLGAEWFTETIRNKTFNQKGHGTWSGVVAGWDYKKGDAVYAGAQARWTWGKVAGQRGQDWNLVGRIGYGWNLSSALNWYFAPYVGVGYESQRVRFVASSKVHFWYLPIGMMLDYHFNPNFMVGLKAEYGLMFQAKYRQFVTPRGKIPMANRSRCEVELPFTYLFTGFSHGHLDISLVPFWHGWRAAQKMNAELTSPNLIVNMCGARLDFGWRF